MLNRVILLATLLITGQSFLTHAQKVSATDKHALGPQEKQDATQRTGVPNLLATASVQTVALPAAENAWAVQIISRGGLTGAGRGDLTVTSDGSLVWSAERSCGGKLTEDAMLQLTKLVAGAGGWSNESRSTLVGACSDCYITTMILQRRESDGLARTYMVSWDDANWTQMPSDALKLSEALMAQLMAHEGCKLLFSNIRSH